MKHFAQSAKYEAALSSHEARLTPHFFAHPGKKNGANNRNRTDDLFITSELLYRLSYIGTCYIANILHN